MALDIMRVFYIGQIILVALQSVSGKTRGAGDVIRAEVIRGCKQEVTCFHGTCSVGSYSEEETKCLCEKNWEGMACDEPVRKDQMTSTTHQVTSQFPIKESFAGNSASFIESLKPPRIRLPDEHELDQNVCDKRYVRRPRSERRCTMGLWCTFGVCERVENDRDKVVFECRCDKGAIGMLCDHKCCKDCGTHGQCFLSNNGTEMCDCRSGFTGEFCHLPNPKPVFSHQQVGVQAADDDTTSGTLVAVLTVVPLFLLLASLILMSTILWKRRTLLVMKLARFFRPYEDNYLCSQDVLLCYDKNPDSESFVRSTLVPRIEEMSLQICVYTVHDGMRAEGEEERFYASSKGSRRILIVDCESFRHHLTACEQQVLLSNRSRIVNIRKSPKSDEFLNCKKKDCDKLRKLGISLTFPEQNQDQARQKFWEVLKTLMPKRRTPVKNTHAFIVEVV